ncbi:hypothetical protein L228DRAFT_247202 [Xylona heveae TC161]|uniref:Uncharacterized protein n=1 Tax=Xylona heveae (strain CBS 132557 / TC161) TaxID=1328760 RepID=A0A165GZZ2_XYLHT|nr:hypothetical protein L228DRAFT_247202 [Xylona heveae TC161]KZF22814.1 hypothetical protein L228DRAFT_247202 [Xylona heveae TC161]
MEAAPLTLAHAHARSAVKELHKSNATAASEEHELAAGEFAHAAKGSNDAEALRTLQLLEQHHQKLAQILKFRSSVPTASAGPSEKVDTTSDAATSVPSPQPGSPIPAQSPSSLKTAIQQQQPPSLPTPSRAPTRDLSSSIASNLATARGIPANQQRRAQPVSPTLTAQHAGGKVSGPAKARTRATNSSNAEKAGAQSPPKLMTNTSLKDSPTAQSPTREVEKQKANTASKKIPASNDEPFQRFYSTFEGFLSRLSAPLAFAGLPLTSEESAPPAPPQELVQRQRPSQVQTAAKPDKQERASADPDVTKLFSRAALRAIREENGASTSGPFGGAESFYVVPTTGGTISYAGILSRAEQDSARNSALGLGSTSEAGDDQMDEFVDARESPQPSSPNLHRRLGSASSSRLAATGTASGIGLGVTSRRANKTMEELQLENSALKQLSDTLSRRLHMWEANAQSSSLALQQSLRAMHPNMLPQMQQSKPASLTTGTGAGVATVGATAASTAPGSDADRLREIEEQLRLTRRELEKTAHENEKLRTVVSRYRERWSKLKEGARVRREGGGTTSGAGGGSGGTTPVAGGPGTVPPGEVTAGGAAGVADKLEDVPM